MEDFMSYVNFQRMNECIELLSTITKLPLGIMDCSGKLLCNRGIKGVIIDNLKTPLQESTLFSEYSLIPGENKRACFLPISTGKKVHAYLVSIISSEMKKDTIKKIKFLEYFRDFISYSLFYTTEQNDIKNQLNLIFETDTKLSEKNCLAYASKEKAFRLAYFDSLYSFMPNRNYLKLFGEEITHSSKPFILLYLDISGLKVIKDTLGYRTADTWLKRTMKKLMDSLSSDEKVFRWEEDAFIFIFGSTERTYIKNKAEVLLNIVEEPCEISDSKVKLSGHIGSVIYPEDSISFEELVRKACITVRTSQITGNRTLKYYDEKISEKIVEKLEIEKDIEKALAEKEFFLSYQPVFDAQNNLLYCFEALIRWKHPNKGIILPSEFIPTAEKTDFIERIGEWVIEEVFSKIQELGKLGYDNLKFSLNISVRQIGNRNFLEYIELCMKKYSVKPENIILEITETVMINNFSKDINEFFYRLKEMGFKIALDDFGSGYSSISYLKNIPFDIIKIDKIFIDKISEEGVEKLFIKTALAIGEKLGKQIIAEGVESEQQKKLLLLEGCRLLQGYIFSKPIKDGELLTYLDYSRKISKTAGCNP